jgi:hypothetical protein
MTTRMAMILDSVEMLACGRFVYRAAVQVACRGWVVSS